MYQPTLWVFFFRAVQYIVQYGMGLRRDDDFSYLFGYVSGLLYPLWHTVNGAEEAWDNTGENSNLFAIADGSDVKLT
jgi:hypothetical protein